MNKKLQWNIISFVIGGTMGLILAIYGELQRKNDVVIYKPNSEITAAVDTVKTEKLATREKTTEKTTTKVNEPQLCDVPLSDDFQKWLIEYCYDLHLSPYLVMAVCEIESNYNVAAIGDNGNSIGIMQIQPRWHYERMAALNVTDLTDAQSNIKVGVDILLELFHKNNNPAWVLMAYNGGEAYANRMSDNGVVSDYAKTIINRAIDLESR